MIHHLFIAKSEELTKNVFLEVLFDKEMNLEEVVECYLRIKVVLPDNKKCQEVKKFRYVYKDTMVGIEELVQAVEDLLGTVLKTIEALDVGINLLEDFFLIHPGLDNSDIEVQKETRRALANLTQFKLFPYIIDLYNSVLVKYKGSDTLQQRKYEKMIQAQEDAMIYNRTQRQL